MGRTEAADCEVEHGQIRFYFGIGSSFRGGLFAREPPAVRRCREGAGICFRAGPWRSTAADQCAAPAPAPAPSAPPAPTFRELTIPAETPISVTLVTPIASNTSKVEDQVRGTLAEAIIVEGTTVVPAGSEVTGAVLEARDSGRVKGRASVSVRFDRLTVRGESQRIQTARIAREAASSTKSDVKKGALGAGAGAIIGGIAGGGSGAAIGAGVGGAATVLATKGNEVQLAAGTALSTRLLEPVTVQVPIAQK